VYKRFVLYFNTLGVRTDLAIILWAKNISEPQNQAALQLKLKQFLYRPGVAQRVPGS
jgi:hypothetical protein